MEDLLSSKLLCDSRSEPESRRLARLMNLLLDFGDPPNSERHFPLYRELRQRFLDAAQKSDGDEIEERFLELYAHLHMHEAPYTREERVRMDAAGGYWAHAGGISPILRAADFIGPHTISTDLGAGNGLQGLLLQLLYPHARTIQVEISSRMVEIGRSLQSWLSIAEKRVEWVVGDVLAYQLEDIDFLYLYRPVRPEGAGHRFYQRLAAQLCSSDRRVVIFSIADCLRSYLGEHFELLSSDGHLSCFRRCSPPAPAPPCPAGPAR